MSIREDIQKLEPGALVEMYQLDVGTESYRFHSGVNSLNGDVVWRGDTYFRFPIEADGFEWKSSGTLPRPKLKVANITGLVGALVRQSNDLVGCRFVRRRTMAKYLDAINFPGGVNPSADPVSALPDEIFSIDRKSGENAVVIEFELAAAMDVQGTRLPRRQIVQNVCTSKYRSAECGYTGPMVDIEGNPTTDPMKDVCSKRLTDGCKARWGAMMQLPYGGFPAAGLLR